MKTFRIAYVYNIFNCNTWLLNGVLNLDGKEEIDKSDPDFTLSKFLNGYQVIALCPIYCPYNASAFMPIQIEQTRHR